jgi:hypothetical protein
MIQAPLENLFLFEPPFEVTPGGPVGHVAFGDAEAFLVQGRDDVFVGDGVPEHVVDHIALELGQRSNAAIAADCARAGGAAKGAGLDDRRHGANGDYGGWKVEGGDGRGAGGGFRFNFFHGGIVARAVGQRLSKWSHRFLARRKGVGP